MARTHSTYSASPTQQRSPQRSLSRQPSQDGSAYEMDLDALGLNSTFESTEIDEKHKPKIDVVDTSDIEGPDDFTINMTYWMTAELPQQQQILSRKEAKINVELRGDVEGLLDKTQGTTAEGDRASMGGSALTQEGVAEARQASVSSGTGSAIPGQSGNRAVSEVSMEHGEKVRSYLSALPDIDIGKDALTSTPLRLPKRNMLQVPSAGLSKARSLQATVEDYDTPRKPTQETVIHHPQEMQADVKQDSLEHDTTLQFQQEQQTLTSRTKITELETLLCHSRTDLWSAREECHKQRDYIVGLESENMRQRKQLDSSHVTVDRRLKVQEEEFHGRMQEFGEELRLQNLAKIQDLKDDFERKVEAQEDAKRALNEVMAKKDQLLTQQEDQLLQLQGLLKQATESTKKQPLQQMSASSQTSFDDYQGLQDRLASLQSRADSLQADLERATEEANIAREETEAIIAQQSSSQSTNEAQAVRIVSLESKLQSFENNLRLPAFHIDSIDKQLEHSESREAQISSITLQLEQAREEIVAKDKQLQDVQHLERCLSTMQGRHESLEGVVSSLRQQLADAHRNSAKSLSDVQQSEHNLEEAADRLQDARAEADRRINDVEKKLNRMKDMKLEAEGRWNDLEARYDELVENHEREIEEVRETAEDAVRKAGALLEQGRSEKKRIVKEHKKISKELEHLRAEVAQKAAAKEDSSADDSSFLTASHNAGKDVEIENLRTLLHTQAATLKSLKYSNSSLRKEIIQLKSLPHSPEKFAELQLDLDAVRQAHTRLEAQALAREAEFEAVYDVMDERLAIVLSNVLKEKTKNIIGKRDEQWTESAKKMGMEREILSKLLLREWGRQEVGPALKGERQGYRYKFAKRS